MTDRTALEFVNHHRESNAPFQRPLDPAEAGWTGGDVEHEAKRLGWVRSVVHSPFAFNVEVLNLTTATEAVHCPLLMEVEGVTDAAVAVHGALDLEYFVRGGDDQAIGEAIQANRVFSTITRGSTEVVVEAPGYAGGTVTVRFTRC